MEEQQNNWSRFVKKKKKQISLFQFGFAKQIKHSKTLVNVAAEDSIDDEKTLPCHSCEKPFKSKQGLSMHTALGPPKFSWYWTNLAP